MNGSSLNTQGIVEVYPGVVLQPTGGKIFFVSNSGPSGLDYLPPGMVGSADGFFTSVQQALSPCRSGRGDRIMCLPGHAEPIAIADAWSNLGTKTDIRVIGLGAGSNRPTFTWTTATSSVLFDQANFAIENCRLFLAGAHAAGSALTVAAPITVSADGWEISDCEIAYGFQANRIVSIGITTTAAATRGKFDRNDVYAETIAVPTTTFLRLTGADFFRMEDTTIIGPGSSTTIGPVQELTTATLKKRFNRSTIKNTVAASTVSYTAIAGTGNLKDCSFPVGTGTLAVTAGSALTAGNCYTFSVATGLQTLLAIT
jgi:hypothetical protein